MKKALFLILLSIFLISCQKKQPTPEIIAPSTPDTAAMNQIAPDQENAAISMSETEKSELQLAEYDYAGTLHDVTGGSALGLAMATWTDTDQYHLQATFENLPELAEGYFYEGWVVRSQPFHFVSTGKVEVIDGVFTNLFASEINLTDHLVYVLTLEPEDDGLNGQPDPAPAEHVLEGTLEKF